MSSMPFGYHTTVLIPRPAGVDAVARLYDNLSFSMYSVALNNNSDQAIPWSVKYMSAFKSKGRKPQDCTGLPILTWPVDL